MSSHREAPQISKDPVADCTDLYAFVSPDQPDTVTLIANYVPLQAPDGGPNFYEFGDDVLYAINIDNDGDGDADISFQFQFTSRITDPDTFLYNTGPITSPDQPDVEPSPDLLGHPGRRARAPRPRDRHPLPAVQHRTAVDAGLSRPWLSEAITTVAPGTKVLAGQRAEGFYVDLGAIFDLGILRPFEQDHTTFGLAGTGIGKMAKGVNSTDGVNVHSIAIQVPISQLTAHGSKPTSVTDPAAVLGVWTTASRQKARIFGNWPGENYNSGPYAQVSRLGNPLVNEVLIPMAPRTTGTPCRRPRTRSSRPMWPTPSSPGCSTCSTPGCSRTWRPTYRRAHRVPTSSPSS